MKNKLLITGSAGFLFSNFVRKVIYENHPYEISSIDKIDYNVKNSIYWSNNHKFYLADITDEHILNNIFQFEKPDIVIHGAASTSVNNSINNPNIFIHNNIFGTQNIINNCIKYKVKKLIYISSEQVAYATNEPNYFTFNEDAPLNPNNVYASSKAASELLVRAAHTTHDLNYNILRLSSNYGIRQSADKLIPKTIKCILNDQKIELFGNGSHQRDWINVNDTCDAILTILNKGNPNQIYNISANQELSNLEMVQKICNIMEKGHHLISFVPDRKSNDFRYVINSDKLKSLGWIPKIKLKDGLKETIQWFRDNQTWIFNS